MSNSYPSENPKPTPSQLFQELLKHRDPLARGISFNVRVARYLDDVFADSTEVSNYLKNIENSGLSDSESGVLKLILENYHKYLLRGKKMPDPFEKHKPPGLPKNPLARKGGTKEADPLARGRVDTKKDLFAKFLPESGGTGVARGSEGLLARLEGEIRADNLASDARIQALITQLWDEHNRRAAEMEAISADQQRAAKERLDELAEEQKRIKEKLKRLGWNQ